jgi:hypothetical protein
MAEEEGGGSHDPERRGAVEAGCESGSEVDGAEWRLESTLTGESVVRAGLLSRLCSGGVSPGREEQPARLVIG